MIGPEMRTIFGIDKLSCNSHSRSSLAHTTFQNVSNTQLPSNLFDIDGPTFVGEARLRAITKSHGRRDSPIVISSRIPSAKYSCSGSELKFAKGRTAIDGVSGSAMDASQFLAQLRPLLRFSFHHLSDKTDSLAWQCFDQALLLAGIADCIPGGVQAGRQRSVRDNASVPNDTDEVVFADDALPISNQIIEQVKNLRCHRYCFPAPMQFAPLRVKCVILEAIAQIAIPSPGLPNLLEQE